MTDLRVPETRADDWSTRACPARGYDAMWHRGLLPSSNQPVSRMAIHDIRHGKSESERRVGYWKLYLYTSESERMDPPRMARVVTLGRADEFDSLDEAVMEAVRVGAREAGKREKSEYTVYVPYSGSSSIRVSALSEREALSIVYRWVRSGDSKFFDNAKDDGFEYEHKDIGL